MPVMDPQDRFDSLFRFYAVMNYVRRENRFVAREIPLDWELMKRQGIAESDLRPDAISPVGAKGLMQIMDATWDEWVANEYGATPPPRRWVSQFNPEESISAACDMMSWLMRVFQQDARKALAAYNAGIGRVSRLVGAHGAAWETYLPDETKVYLARILV